MSEDFSTNEIRSFKKGDVVFYEGDKSKDLFIISSGEVEIVKNILAGEVILARLGVGDFFGEMAMFGGKPRSATVRAKTDLEAIVVKENYFQEQMANLPDWFGNMFEVLISRIREMDSKIVSQFKYGLGLSILQLIQLISEHYGTHTDNQLAVKQDFLIDKIHFISGLSIGIIEKHIGDFIGANIIEFETETEKIVIRDKNLVENLIEFSLSLTISSDIEEVKKQIPHLSEQDVKMYFEKYKIIRNEHSDPLSIVSI